MATSATISVITPEDRVITVYNHWDGGSHLLNLLKNHYNTLESALALVEPGNISSVRERCDGDGAHTFNNPIPDQTIYYGRDRGEDGQEAFVQDLDMFNIRGVKESPYGPQDYNYVFFNGEWLGLQKYKSLIKSKSFKKVVDI